MGVVYWAEDMKLERPMALKFLSARLLLDEPLKKRFEREAKAAAALRHANICTVFEIDQVGDQTFIAMELLEGETLDTKISRGPLKLRDALDIGRQIADGLDAAHKRSIFHRDIKPENVMVDDDGRVILMDFGLARLADVSRLTRTNETLGTVAYMSPEQADGTEADHRADIWSLGVVLYELLTGRRPFTGDLGPVVLYSILNDEPEPVTAIRTGVPMEVEFIVGKCLGKAAGDRYQHVDELSGDLRAQLAHLGSSSSRRAISSSTNSGVVDGPSKIMQRFVIAFAFVAAAVFCGLWVTELKKPEPPRSVRRFSITPEEGVQTAAISPDGKQIAYITPASELKFWNLRTTQVTHARDVKGFGPLKWAPDSQTIAFHNGLEFAAVSTTDFSVNRLAAAERSPFTAGTWSADGFEFIFSDGNALGYSLKVAPLQGGDPETLTDIDGMPLARISHQPTVKARVTCVNTLLRSLAVLDVLSSTPARAKGRAPRIDAPSTHFPSPPGEKCGLV